jgi:hypothetical protein
VTGVEPKIDRIIDAYLDAEDRAGIAMLASESAIVPTCSRGFQPFYWRRVNCPGAQIPPSVTGH